MWLVWCPTRQDRQNVAISGCLTQQNIRACANHTRSSRILAMNMPSWALIQLILSTFHRPFTHIKLTIASTTVNGCWEQAAVRETMCNLHWWIEITAQIRIMKSIQTASDKRQKPQINNNTAINPIRSLNRHWIVIKCRPFNRHSRPISYSTNKSDPSTRPIRFIPTDGICSLKIICENPRIFNPGEKKSLFFSIKCTKIIIMMGLIEFQFLPAGNDTQKKETQSWRLKFNTFWFFFP